jgi:hypothetical protein
MAADLAIVLAYYIKHIRFVVMRSEALTLAVSPAASSRCQGYSFRTRIRKRETISVIVDVYICSCFHALIMYRHATQCSAILIYGA